MTGIKNSLVKWREEFTTELNEINCDKLMQKCGVWGCLLGGVLTSKIAQ
jgi:hypothetical protein